MNVVNLSELEVRSAFTLAGIEVLNLWQLQNGYGGELRTMDASGNPTTEEAMNFVRYNHFNPWWLVKTKLGLIRLGWRKRVIHLDWEDTGFKANVTDEAVTKSDSMVHAWSLVDLVRYLTRLRELWEVGYADVYNWARLQPGVSQDFVAVPIESLATLFRNSTQTNV